MWYIWFNDSNDNDNHRDRLHRHIERDVENPLGNPRKIIYIHGGFSASKDFWRVNVALLKLAKRDKNIQELCKIQYNNVQHTFSNPFAFPTFSPMIKYI